MKAAAINDISGFGKCSLIADISVLTVMGIQVCPVPTAVLTAQTGFPSYYCEDMTQTVPRFTEEWSKKGEHFDGILTGFFMNERQVDEAIRFVSQFHVGNAVLLVDPVMADQGEGYMNYSEPLLCKMRLLTQEADILTPNISELCLLAGADMQEVLALSGDALCGRLEKLAEKMLAARPKTIIVTGVPVCADQSLSDGDAETRKDRESPESVGNLIVDQNGARLLKNCQAGGAFSGTGDLFAAVILGGVLRGQSIEESTELAERFIYQAADAALKNHIEKNEGTEYEQYLHMLHR